MYRRVFKPKGGRVYRLRYRVGDEAKIHDVPLRTPNKEVAEASADKIIREHEMELLGNGIPKTLRDAAKLSIKEHLAEYIADLETRNRSKSHIKHARCRLILLFDACRWTSLREVSAERFLKWRADNSQLSQKTRNEYLGHVAAFFNWLMRQERATQNPFKSVFKMETKGNETFRRRSLTLEEVTRLVASTRKRGLVYFTAGCTGLRRNELKQLIWPDLRLDVPQPFIELRAETTKSKRPDVIPLIPPLAHALSLAKAKTRRPAGKVFPLGIPHAKTLAKDLQACGIKVEDERGFRVDFHALRHTFASLLANAGVSELARVKLARHTSWRQTDRYTDPKSIPLFLEIEKLTAALASSLASPKSGKTGQNESKPVQSDAPFQSVKVFDSPSEKPNISPEFPALKVAERGGFEPPVGCPTPAFQAGTLNHSATSP